MIITTRTLKEYFYTMDYNFYYHNNGQTLTQITRKEYKEKTGESDYIINKLRNSIFPYQKNDYFFKRNPSFNKYAPIDWKIYNFDKYLNKNGFETGASDQSGWYDSGGNRNFGRILVQIKVIPFLKQKFGEKNIILVESNWTFGDKEPLSEIFEHWAVKKSSKKLLIKANNNKKNYYKSVLYFKESNLPWIHEKLNLEFPDHSKAHRGRRIIDQRDGENPDL